MNNPYTDKFDSFVDGINSHPLFVTVNTWITNTSNSISAAIMNYINATGLKINKLAEFKQLIDEFTVENCTVYTKPEPVDISKLKKND
jgi:hypothetical protein